MNKYGKSLITSIVVCVVTAAHAQEPTKVSGKFFQKPIPYDVPAMRGVQAVPVVFWAAEHTFQGGGIFDGAKGTVSGFADAYSERMPLNGVTRYEKAGSTFVTRWGGHCITGKSDSKPLTMCSGDYVVLPGATGVFAGIVLSGTWTGVMTPDGNFDARFDAMYTK